MAKSIIVPKDNKVSSVYKRYLGYLKSPGIILSVGVGLLGCLAIYNATFHIGRPFYFVGRQILWLCVGVVTLVVCSLIPPRYYDKGTLPLAALTLFLLYGVLFWGVEINGMRGWYGLSLAPVGRLFLQPSELAKPIFILFLVKIVSSQVMISENPRKFYLFYTCMGILWFIPILIQPDFGTFTLFIVGFVCIYWFSGGNIVYLITTFLAGIPFIIFAIQHHHYLQRRLAGFFNPLEHAQDSGWHILQLQATLASGGLWGRSFGNAIWSRSYLPLGYSDSIFATLAESVGFAGATPIIIGVVAWILYCMSVARNQSKAENALIVVGISTMLGIQAFLHISVTLGLVPPTGITLPMFSYGGSSLVSTMASIGIVLSFANNSKKKLK